MPKSLQESIILTATAFSEAESWWRSQAQHFIQWCKLHKHGVHRYCKCPGMPQENHVDQRTELR